MWFLAIALPTLACDRPSVPPVGFAAAADAIVVAHGSDQMLTVDYVLRGEVPKQAFAVRLEELCGRPGRLDDTPRVYHLRHDPDGWFVHSDGQAEAATGIPPYILEPVARASGARWSDISDGWASLLVVEPGGEDTPAGTSFTVGIRNFGPAARTLSWNDWPRERASHVVLDVVGPAGPVAAVPTGITPENVRAYFEPNGRHFEVVLQPGEFWLFPVKFADTAPPGWGYKEELGFHYYPMPAPGPYTVVARLLNLAEPMPPLTLPVTIVR